MVKIRDAVGGAHELHTPFGEASFDSSHGAVSQQSSTVSELIR